MPAPSPWGDPWLQDGGGNCRAGKGALRSPRREPRSVKDGALTEPSLFSLKKPRTTLSQNNRQHGQCHGFAGSRQLCAAASQPEERLSRCQGFAGRRQSPHARPRLRGHGPLAPRGASSDPGCVTTRPGRSPAEHAPWRCVSIRRPLPALVVGSPCWTNRRMRFRGQLLLAQGLLHLQYLLTMPPPEADFLQSKRSKELPPRSTEHQSISFRGS